ncbi:M13 family peptidase [Robertkochia marina]|uniref:M13 family peptidase n=1 Tax=Robertkochia marina TaxID=1227945 RepID=A0A4S3M2I6_9FLAO|nr:M13 family metallopeptidase [Robertkochia marina]THD69253.1 M13 family peptidase [Robertkochia marina]TRZ47489.1 M13 family peptidase [Robertkochia marina]
MKNLALLFITAITLFSCSTPETKKEVVMIEGIDEAIKPGDNFFRHVNGIWYDSVQIPPSQSGVGAYRFMNFPQRIRLMNLLDSVSKQDNPEGSMAQKVGDFFSSGMDTATINQRGYEPLQPVLSKIDEITDVASMMGFVANEFKVYNTSFMGFYVGPDDKNSNMNIAHAYQTGIGMPDRDYYFNTDPNAQGIQQAYKTYLATLFELTGSDSATANNQAEMVYNIEKQMAEAHRTRVERRDVEANYNKFAVTELEEKHPNIGWQEFLNNLGAATDSIDVGQPEYYDALNGLLTSIPVEDWKVYLNAHTLSNYADYLSTPFVDAQFAYSKLLSGQAEQQERGEKIASEIDNLLGEALGQIYVNKYFPEEAKERMLELVNNTQKAYEARIDNLEWMNDTTKAKAKEKLFAITKKIGYPDKWRDYSQVEIQPGKYLENVIAAAANQWQYNLDKLGKPVDRSEWYTTPSTVTAYYNPSANEIVFPAGILQPPYFDYEADDALNYGGIGMVIGHELSHAFDDQGAQYDKDGNVKNWWTEEDYEQFQKRTGAVADLYSTFTVLDTLHINGKMTVGENTADVSGVAAAYDAFKMTEQGQDTAKIGGFTPDQRFFLSIARIWRVKMKEEYLRYWIQNDPHSPPIWRVNGPLMNTAAFYSAFDVQPGDEMYLPEEERITVW